MKIDFREMFASAQRRPGMYVMPEPWHARTVVPWLIGCDAATSYQLLGQEFSAWLNQRRGGPGRSSLAWQAEVMVTTLPERSRDYWNLSGEDSDKFLEALFASLDEYLAEKGATFDVNRA